MSVIHKIDSIIIDFLWVGSRQKKKIHLSKLDSICRPIVDGGWGIKDTLNCILTLLTEKLWRDFEFLSIWHKIIVEKYLDHATLED